METFAKPRPFVEHPNFSRDRGLVLDDFRPENIDAPLRGLITRFSHLPFCFTLQCCVGHFLLDEGQDEENLQPLPTHDVGPVKFRIAYLALCLENSPGGRKLYSGLEKIAASDPEYIQFGSPAWFWDRQVNSYALQVEPVRFATSDVAVIEFDEAVKVQTIRDRFFVRLNELVKS